jgi:hypothetical protein
MQAQDKVVLTAVFSPRFITAMHARKHSLGPKDERRIYTLAWLEVRRVSCTKHIADFKLIIRVLIDFWGENSFLFKLDFKQIIRVLIDFPLLVRKSGSAGNRTRTSRSVCIQELLTTRPQGRSQLCYIFFPFVLVM